MDKNVPGGDRPSQRDGADGAGTGERAVGGSVPGRCWLILLIGLVAMTAGCTFQYGLAYLIPALRQQGFSLELTSTLVACPTVGLLLTLIAWGSAADRFGERVVLSTGSQGPWFSRLTVTWEANRPPNATPDSFRLMQPSQ
jgi:hypothetical protein